MNEENDMRNEAIYVAWTRPDATRTRHAVARVRRTEKGFSLVYLAGARVAEAHGFAGIYGMDDLRMEYRSASLFPFMSQRLMSKRRPDYDRWLASMGLSSGSVELEDAFALLTRSQGRRVTDGFEFFGPRYLDDGRWAFDFFVRNIRGNPKIDEHLGAGGALAEPLRIESDPANEFDPSAIMVLDAKGDCLGYVARYFSAALSGSHPETIRVLRVNPHPAKSSYRVLIRVVCELGAAWDFESTHEELQPLLASGSGSGSGVVTY